VETHIHKHEEGELICPHCEREAFPLEGVFQTWYEIDIIAPRIVINEHKQQKYQCKNRCTIWTAPGPLKLSPNAYYSPDFALEIVSDKYLDNMPLERQVRRFERLGLEVDSQTLFDQLYTVFEYARPTVEAIHGNLLGQDVLHADETPWYMLEGPSAGQWTLWALACDHGAFFSASSTRSAVAANILLEGYDGTVICDGASIYPALVGHGGEKTKTEVMEIFKPSGDMETILVRATKWTVPAMTLAFCWAHVLRRFRDCEKHFPRLAGQALTYIRKLYAAEDEALNLARARAGPDISPDAFETLLLEARRTVRQAVSRPVVEAFHPWLCTPRVLGSTQLGEAIDYTLKLWKGLCVFLNDPQVVLDNNAAELILRQAVVGRKAHYGSHSLRGIQVACAFYTLVESARLNGLEPVAYLRRVLYAALETPGTVTLPWVVAQNTERTVTLQARPKARPSWETCSEEAQEEQVG
jgi:transposase